MRTGCGLLLTLVSLSFQTSSPSSSPQVSGPSFLSGSGGAPQGQGRWGQPADGGWPACHLQSRHRPPAPMWRSSSSPSSGACASATSARAAQLAASLARGARTPPRPTPPSRSAEPQSGGPRVRGLGLASSPSPRPHPEICACEFGLEFPPSRVLSVLWTDQWLHRARDSPHLPGHQGPPSPASPPRACGERLPGWLL